MTKIIDPGGQTRERRMKPGQYNRTIRSHGRRVSMRTDVEQELKAYPKDTPLYDIKYGLAQKLVAKYSCTISHANSLIERVWRAQG